MAFFSFLLAQFRLLFKRRALDRAHYSEEGSDSVFLSQVVKKVEALERQCGNIEIDLQHRPFPIPGQEARTPDDQHSIAPTVDSTSVNSQTLGGSDGESVHVHHVPEGGPGGAIAATPLRKTHSEDVARHLISKEDMRDYFSSLVKCQSFQLIEENLSEEGRYLSTSYKESMVQEDQFSILPLKLILTPIRVRGAIVSKFASLLEMQFGPLHAALQVGDVILEWNDTGLIIPHFAEHADEFMRTDVRHLTDWVNFTSGEVPQGREAIRTHDHPQQRELIYRVTAEKRRLLDNLVDVIVMYNQRYYYDIIRRNCQHFVVDALKALGVNKPIDFTGGLGEYYQALKKGKSPALYSRFTDHIHLDKYVREKEENGEVSSMTKSDLEYLLAQYFIYHLEQKRQLQAEDREAELSGWSCEFKNCRMERLERLIDFESLFIHNFTQQLNKEDELIRHDWCLIC